MTDQPSAHAYPPPGSRWLFCGDEVEVLRPQLTVRTRRVHDGLIRYVDTDNLSPLQSPDDEVEVVVKMTRAQRDEAANLTPSEQLKGAGAATVAACRAHRDAEAEQ